jgi:uncharacterized protein YfaT (DUF1175 family)
LCWGAAIVVAAFGASVFLPVSKTYALVPETLPADGTSSARLTWSATNIYGSPVPFYPKKTRVSLRSGGDKVRIVGKPDRSGGPAIIRLGLRAKREPGEVLVSVEDGEQTHIFKLNLVAAEGDRDLDGFPDAVELVDHSDREAFRHWFSAVAEAQFYAADPRWDRIHRDCAGLVRYSYKQALRRHDKSWLSGTPYLHRPNHPDIRRYNFPEVPILGERVFRVSPGPYRPESGVEGEFSASASARMLWEHNTVFISREVGQALRGDLLFFFDPERHASPMHTMVLLDPPDQTDDPRVAYHTGNGSQGDKGEVRIVALSALRTHTDDHWHVRPDNPHFKGFYRWKILEGGRP